MYVVNAHELSEAELYECNAIIANWLIYDKHLPLFSRNNEKRKFYFAKTEALEKALKEMPFYYNIAKNL